MKLNFKANGKKFTLDKSICNEMFDLEVNNIDGHVTCNIIPKIELDNMSFSVYLNEEFDNVKKIFTNGYQSWTDSHEYDFSDKERKTIFPMTLLDSRYKFTNYGDYKFANYKKGLRHSVSYGYLKYADKIKLVGSLNEKTGFTFIYFNSKKNIIKVQKDLEGLKINQPYQLLNFVVISGEYDKVFDLYFKELDVKPRTSKNELGYTSWYKHYQNISESIILKNIESIHESSENFKVFQIDDGFETFVGDWLNINPEKFPNGLGKCVDKIHEYNMMPGIWLAPFSAEKDSDLFKKHPDWLIKGNDNKPIIAGGNWSGFAGLDIYNTEVIKYLEKVFKMYKDFGFKLFKLDFLYAICVIPHHGKTRGEIMEDGMKLLRKLVGNENLILGCGVPLFSSFGKVDFCRIGMDMGLDFDDTWYMRRAHRERVSTKNTMLNTIYRRHLNNRAFLNDPDVFLLRDDLKLTMVQRKNLLYVNSLFGNLLFTSDDIKVYDDEKNNILRNGLEMFHSKVVSVRNSSKYVFVIEYVTEDGLKKEITIDIMSK